MCMPFKQMTDSERCSAEIENVINCLDPTSDNGKSCVPVPRQVHRADVTPNSANECGAVPEIGIRKLFFLSSISHDERCQECMSVLIHKWGPLQSSTV